MKKSPNQIKNRKKILFKKIGARVAAEERPWNRDLNQENGLEGIWSQVGKGDPGKEKAAELWPGRSGCKPEGWNRKGEGRRQGG